MTQAFDPYYQWLGIPPKDQPPNHYRLLGLETFEENRNVIATAADRQMGFIKNYQTGPVEAEELSQRILNELAAARLCLLNPEKKSAYDQALRAALEPPLAEIVPPEETKHRPQTPARPGKPPTHAASPAPARRVPVQAPVVAELVLPRAAVVRPPRVPAAPNRLRSAGQRAEETAVPLAEVGDDEAGEAVVPWKIAPLAIGAGIGCLVLAAVLIAAFAGLTKRERQLERPTPVAASPPRVPTPPAAVPPPPAAEVPLPIQPTSKLRPRIPSAPDVKTQLPVWPPAAVVSELARSEPRTVPTPPIAKPTPEPAETAPPGESVATVTATVDLQVEAVEPPEPLAQVSLLIGEAQRLIDRRNFDDARKKLLQVNLHERDDARACFYLGLMAATVDRNPSDARKYFTRARQANETDPACLNNLALVAVRFRDASQAVRYWQEAWEIGPAPEIDHNVALLLKLVDRDRLKLSSGLRSGIEAALHDGDRSGTSSAGRGFGSGWRYMDWEGDGWNWPVLNDRTCLQCNGHDSAPCPANGCSRGRIRKTT